MKLCRIGLHSWGTWSVVEKTDILMHPPRMPAGTYYIQYKIIKHAPITIGTAIRQERQCSDCGLREFKMDRVYLEET